MPEPEEMDQLSPSLGTCANDTRLSAFHFLHSHPLSLSNPDTNVGCLHGQSVRLRRWMQ